MGFTSVLQGLFQSISLSPYYNYKSALEKKCAWTSQHCKNGICTEHVQFYFLDERICKLNVIALKDCAVSNNRGYVKISVLLTPPPSYGITSILCSPCGQFIALICETSVYVIDGSFGPKEFNQDQVVRAIYCAIDLRDLSSQTKLNSVIMKVRWHPKSSRTLVVVTDNSSIYYICCVKSSESQSIRFNLWLEADLHTFTHSVLDATYQDLNDSDASCGDENDENSILSNNKMDLSFALGSKCVDFDFGSPSCASKRGSTEVQLKDCCLFLLYETGDVIQVCGCLSVRKANQLEINVLRILPPSIDNYGDGFCAIHCVRPIDIQEIFAFEKPPDVLVLADKFGRLHNGIVLRANLPDQNKIKQTTGPSVLLCLIDIVDLDLTTNATADQEEKSFRRNDTRYRYTDTSMPNSSSCEEYDHFDSPSLSLEPAHLNFLDNIEFNCAAVDGSDFVKTRISGMKYSHQGYYVIHHMGIHLVSLPWIKNLSQWCSEFNTELLGECEKLTSEDIRDWQSCVRHLVCGQIIVSTPGEINEENEGKFRLAGFMELPSNLLVMKDKGDQESKKSGILDSSRSSRGVTILFIRAPIQPIESDSRSIDHSCLVQSLSLTVKLDACVKQQRYSKRSELRNTDLSKSTNRSDFTAHIQQILSDDDSHFPVITALNLQLDLSQQHLVQFFIKVSDALRKGPLDRLMKARSFIDQHSRRLKDLILAQYSEAEKLLSKRQELQSKAENLAKRQAVVTERQAMLDKRMANLSGRLAGLGEGPTKAEIAMHNEVLVIRDRLHKGLRQWLSTLQNRRAKLEKQLMLCRKTGRLSVCTPVSGNISRNEEDNEGNQWQLVSDELRRETVEIKMLINAVKTLNTKSINPT
uniref:AAA domain-containing protein n=1 Tax=Trichobilharzia regenti TaxID=157069 RepID=A0AA85KEA2_TRIRE|nr:unnamed protein product [Trichobilharzia regenti]